MPAAPAVTPYRAAGVALGRFMLLDGRRADRAWEAEAMVEHFQPGTVPLLSRHGGLPVGTLDTLRADGPDLHFTATVGDYPDIIDKLRRGHGVSIEPAWGYGPLPDGSYPPGTFVLNSAEDKTKRRRYFTGTLQAGPNLVGIALSDHPAAPMSVAWLVID